jgi:hypothetical protein
MAFIQKRLGYCSKALSIMEDNDYELFKLTLGIENTRTFLLEITVLGAGGGLWFSDIRSYIEQMDLLDYQFNFWNASCGSPIDRKFEKAIKVQGAEVVILRSESVLGKRSRDEEAGSHPQENMASIRASGLSVNDEYMNRPEETFCRWVFRR